METMSTLVDRLAARLQEKGIDPANFAGNVPRAVETLTTDRAEAGSLLGRIYGYAVRFHAPLPAGIDEAEELLLYREFVADAAREIIQSALNAYRSDLDRSEPGRFIRQAKNKLSPSAKIGKGLVKSIWATVESFQNKTMDRATAFERIDVELGEEHERVLSDLIGQEPTRRSVSARVCARQPT